MRQGSEKLGVMQSSDCLENETHENMRQLTILQSFGLSYRTWGIHYVLRVLYEVYFTLYCASSMLQQALATICHFTSDPMRGIISISSILSSYHEKALTVYALITSARRIASNKRYSGLRLAVAHQISRIIDLVFS